MERKGRDAVCIPDLGLINSSALKAFNVYHSGGIQAETMEYEGNARVTRMPNTVCTPDLGIINILIQGD